MNAPLGHVLLRKLFRLLGDVVAQVRPQERRCAKVSEQVYTTSTGYVERARPVRIERESEHAVESRGPNVRIRVVEGRPTIERAISEVQPNAKRAIPRLV